MTSFSDKLLENWDKVEVRLERAMALMKQD